MIEIIPAIDLIDGKCVRLTQGDFERKTVYSDDPLEVAKRFEAVGIKRLHIVDLDGARNGKLENLKTLERVVAGCGLKIDFGGGIKTDEDLESVFNAGADVANVGSVAIREPEKFLGWVEKYGEKILLGADAKNGKVSIDGWQTETDLSVIAILRSFADRGVTSAFVTDVRRDGAMEGPALDFYIEIMNAVPEIELIASGGVRSVDDIDQLANIGCTGVIIGKAIYEGAIHLEQLSKYVG